MEKTRRLRVSALRLVQRGGVPLYAFAVGGRIIHSFAAVDAADRASDGTLVGYQRPQVQRHIAEIRAYLQSDEAILPNAVVLSLESSCQFEPLPDAIDNDWGTLGSLVIPLPRRGEPKPALVVDGQQRISALAGLDPTDQFPVVVVGFQTDSRDRDREQFLLVNRTRPLPRDLLTELLPHVETELPVSLLKRQRAGQILELLRYSEGSPFLGRVRGVGADGGHHNISQAGVLNVIQRLMKRGAAFDPKLHPELGLPEIAEALIRYYSAVKQMWPEAWEGSPRTSRLVHGVGLWAIGVQLDHIVERCGPNFTEDQVVQELGPLQDYCAWTSGSWPKLGLAWNDLQNTSADKRKLADLLGDELQLAWKTRSSDRPEEALEWWDARLDVPLDDVPLAFICAQLATVVRSAEGPMTDEQVIRGFEERYGVPVTESRRSWVVKMLWSAGGREYIRRDGDLWSPGGIIPEPDERWGDWSINLLKRFAKTIPSDTDRFKALSEAACEGFEGSSPKLAMSVAGIVLREA